MRFFRSCGKLAILSGMCAMPTFPGALAIVLWATISYRLSLRGLAPKVLSVVLLAVIAAGHLEQWRSYHKRRDAQWPAAARVIQQAVDARRSGTLRDPVSLRVPVQPARWNEGAITFVLVPNP